MAVASDNSVASIFRPASAPRTKADSSKNEGAGSFGMMLDRSNKGQNAPAHGRADAPARTSRRDDTHPAADRPKTKDTKTKDTETGPKSETTAADKPAADVNDSKAATDTKTNSADTSNTPQMSKTPQTSDKPAANATQQTAAVAETQTALAIPAEAPSDLTALKDALAKAGVVAAETSGEGDTETKTEDSNASTETKADTGPVDAAVVPVAADANQAPAPAIAAAITVPTGVPVTTSEAPEGDAGTIDAAKPATAQPSALPAQTAETAPAAATPVNADTSIAVQPAPAETAAAPSTPPEIKTEATVEAPQETAAKTDTTATSDVTAQAKPVTDTDTEVTPNIKVEAKTETISDTSKTEAKADTSTETKAEAKSDAKAEAKTEAKAEALATVKPGAAEAKPEANGEIEPAIKFSDDNASAKSETKDVRHADKPAREAAADQTAKPADTTLATVKAAIDAVQNLNNPTPAHTAAPSLHVNAATAASVSAAIANNVQPYAVPIDGVAVEIAAQSLNGKNSFQIRLDPAELGRIDVKLEVDKDGNVTTKLMAERPETLDLLRRDQVNLERTLQQAGLKTSDNAMQFSLRDQQSFADTNRNDGNGSNSKTAQLVLPDDDGAPLEAVRSNYGRLLGLGRGLDIRI